MRGMKRVREAKDARYEPILTEHIELDADSPKDAPGTTKAMVTETTSQIGGDQPLVDTHAHSNRL